MHPNSEHAIIPPLRETVNLHNTTQNDNLPAALMSDVEHAFIRSDDGNFIAIGRYLIRYGREEVIGVLGDGFVPLTIVKASSGESVRANFTCSYGDIQNSPATVILMRGHHSFEEHYYKRGSTYKSPFSSNGDRFRTMIILCEKLKFDRGLSRHPPLILQSQDDSFSLTIGSSFQRPVGQVKSAKSTIRYNRLVHCLNPVYGLKDPRWLIEYLEYHRAIGVEHVHVYNVDLHTPEIQSALELYRKEGFITRHDWSGKASGDYTTQITYEHAKWASQTDCALRSRGMFDYALFSDIDEVAVGPNSSSTSAYPKGHLAPALELCDEANKKNGKIACSFNSKTVTSIYTNLDNEEEIASKDKLFLERYNRIEAHPFCPANCRCLAKNCTVLNQLFHYGRQKYFANVGDTWIPPRPMWTHALSRDYNEMKGLMEVLPEEVMHVRHYQGHWYIKNNLIDSVAEIDAPLLQSLMDTVRSSILDSTGKESTHTKQSIYSNAKDVASSSGLDWITPVTTATSQEEDE